MRKFKRIKRAYWSFWIIFVVSLLSAGAEFLANDRPIVMSYNDSLFFPIFETYKGFDFGIDSPLEPQYKKMELEGKGWAIWPLVTHWGSNESNRSLDRYPAPPSTANWLGTDDRGRDILTRLIHGYRVSMFFGLVTLVLAIILAVLTGGIQGYLGGWIDLSGQRAIEVWSALPYLYVLILLVNIYEPSITMLILANSAFAWIGLSYYVRAEVLKVRKQTYVEAAQSMGCGHGRIMWAHIIPNSLIPIITYAPFVVNLAINNLAVLDFLGLGVPAPTASIGELLRQGKTHFITSWWLAVFPFTVLVGAIVCINFVGEGLREAFDPRKTIL